MPRKKGGLPYEVHPTPAKGKDGKNIMYVKPARGYKMNMSAIDQFCSSGGYSLREGELSRAFDVFMSAAAELMSRGYRIDTTIGSFAPKLALRREITDADEVKNSDVMLNGVEYKPGKKWDKAIGKWLYNGFRKVDTPNVQEIIGDKEHLEKALAESLKRGYTTVRAFAHHANLTQYSARKQLNEWTKGENPKLMKSPMCPNSMEVHLYKGYFRGGAMFAKKGTLTPPQPCPLQNLAIAFAYTETVVCVGANGCLG